MEDKQGISEPSVTLKKRKMNISDIIPSERMPTEFKTSSDLLSYLEKFRVKEDLRRMLSSHLSQVKAFMMLDHKDIHDKVKMTSNSKEREKSILEFTKLNDLLISLKSCECEYPNIELVMEVTRDYRSKLKTKLDVLEEMSMHEIEVVNDKIATCNILIHTCEVLDHNIIWKEHLVGGFAMMDEPMRNLVVDELLVSE